MPDLKDYKDGTLDVLNKVQLQISYKDYASTLSIDERISKEKLRNLLKKELVDHGVNTKFEFAITAKTKRIMAGITGRCI